MGTATLKTRNMEKRTPRDSFLRKKKNASGGVESKFLSCKECGIEFCTGNSCKIFDYDSFKRIAVSTILATNEQTQEQTSIEKKSPKKKSLTKGSKIKSIANKTPIVANKNAIKKNDQKIISVKTNRKNSTIIPENKNIITKSKENIKTIKDISSKGNIEKKNNTTTKGNLIKKNV